MDGCFLGKQSGEQMGERLRAHDQALCVVNTKRQAAELFRQLGEEEDGCFYLSTNLTPQHRKQVIAQIRKRLSDPARPVCRVVSTQLIEAGVDLDFPVVYRSLAGIDSILQAAGRCNREGKLPNATVYVYDPAESYLGSGYLGTTARIARDVIDDFGETDFLSEQAVDAYFAELYDLSGDQVDKYDISRENRQDAVNMQFQFQQIADKFKLIDSQGVPVIIRDDGTQREDGDDHPDSVNRLLEQLPYVKGLGGILQKLSQHSVNVRPQVLERLEMLGAISRPLMDSSGNSTDGVYVLERPEYYHHLTGLTVPDEENELDYIV